jgi:hypothetical protein
MDWYEAIELVTPYVVRILTPGGSETGWLMSRSGTTSLCGVATAAHVIDHAHEWDEPIRIVHPASGGSVLLKPDERAVLQLEPTHDSAAVVFAQGNLHFPEEPLSLIGRDEHYKPGVELGWLGFPAMAPSEMCFFSGRVSAFVDDECCYLVDGVAINGVSGGPAFVAEGRNLDMAGIVSAYLPNRAPGESLPGLAMVRDVTEFHDLTARFRSLDEAKDEESPPSETPCGEEEGS